MHNRLKDAGFKFHHSSGAHGVISHSYSKSLGKGDYGSARIIERANGNHELQD